MSVNRLDDQDYPAVTMGQAAELLDVQPAFLRSLDTADVVRPARSAGGHRRYSRRELERAARMRALFDEGLNLDAARRIVGLEDQVERLTDELADIRDRLNTHDAHTRNGHVQKGRPRSGGRCEPGRA